MARQAPRRNQHRVKTQLAFGIIGMGYPWAALMIRACWRGVTA
jgi:hypothetical protein